METHADSIETLYYLHGSRAAYIEGDNVTPVKIDGVMDLKSALEKLLTQEKIDAVIHAMAGKRLHW